MAELLHEQNPSSGPTRRTIAPHEVLQQINLEDEFAAELNLLKKQLSEPRNETVGQLLQLIHDRTAVEH